MMANFLIVAVSYTAMLEDGTVFERKGNDGEQTLVFVTDEGRLTILDLLMFFGCVILITQKKNLTAVLIYFAVCCL